MNKQGTKTNPLGGIEWTHIFGPGTGYTANPVRGCQHQCRWRMPDGNVAVCYAEAQRDRLSGAGAFQNITFHPEVLDAIRKHQQPAGIFIDSMADLFGQGVSDTMLRSVLNGIAESPQHVFFSLTKNPTRLRSGWLKDYQFPSNLFLGVSMPPTFMFGKELTLAQQRAWFEKALNCLAQCNARVRWVSLEPLSWDCSDILAKYTTWLHWAVIGAASNGAKTYQPDPMTVRRVLTALGGSTHWSNPSQDTSPIPVFYKGNLKPLINSNNWAWRQEFPKL